MKLVLCRPQGGFNDMLVQIEKCCRYAERENRIVVVDTAYKHTNAFYDAFSNYFTSRHDNLILDINNYSLSEVERPEIYPSFLQGRIDSYKTRWAPEVRNHIDIETNSLTTFDMSKSYPQKVLVHHQSGGGELSFHTLSRIALQKSLVMELTRRVLSIGGPYIAVHIRNTDYRTKYDRFLEQISSINFRKIFVATDNSSVVKDFKVHLGDSRVLSFSDLSSRPGIPLHRNQTFGPLIQRRNRDTILDLFTLALANKLYILPIEKQPLRYSGYSLLANNLWKNKSVLKTLLPEFHSLGL